MKNLYRIVSGVGWEGPEIGEGQGKVGLDASGNGKLEQATGGRQTDENGARRKGKGTETSWASRPGCDA